MTEKVEGYDNVLKLVRKEKPTDVMRMVPTNQVLTYLAHASLVRHNPYAVAAAYMCLASQMEGTSVEVTPQLFELLDHFNPDDLLPFLHAEDIYNQEF